MIYQIENEFLCVLVSTKGGELQSIRRKKDESEYLWQGDPAIWEDRSPNLFPICGRLKDKAYTWQGKEYHMPIHGFLSGMELEPIAKESDRICLMLCANDETRAMYPFGFRYEVEYTLKDTSLHITYRVENQTEEILPFSLGAHPGFALPMEEGERFDDYCIEFEHPFEPQTLRFSDEGLCLRKTKPIALIDNRILPLSHALFDENRSVFFREMPHSLTLKSTVSGRFIRMDYPGFPYLGLWQADHCSAPYLCIEPWYGTPATHGAVDDFATKHDMIRLRAGKRFEIGMDITFG